MTVFTGNLTRGRTRIQLTVDAQTKVVAQRAVEWYAAKYGAVVLGEVYGIPPNLRVRDRVIEECVLGDYEQIGTLP